MNLDKAFNDYKVKGKIKLSEDLNEFQKNDALNKIREVFDKSAELYYYSQRYSMSHVILALNNVINTELRKKPDKLRKKLTDLRKKVTDCKTKKLKYAELKLTNEIKNTAMELNSLTNKVPSVSIHLIVREHYGDLTIDCYNRRDETSNKDFYCFEITIKTFSKEERNGVCYKLCEAIGCLYYGYDSIIKRYKNNEIGHNIGTVAEMQEIFGLNKEEIDIFTKKLFELRKENFVTKRDLIKADEKLKARLSSYTP